MKVTRRDALLGLGLLPFALSCTASEPRAKAPPSGGPGEGRQTVAGSGGSAMACSQYVTSSSGEGTASATPVWLAPHEPGRTVSAPPWPAGA